MSAPSDRAAWWTRFDPLVLPRVMIWSVFVAILSYTVADPDLWGHVRFGMDILDQRAIPRVDPYSFTSDRPWVNHEWLSEVVFGGAYRLGGPPGLAATKLVLLLSTFVLLSRDLARRHVTAVPRDLLVLATIVGSTTIIRTARPQLFSLLFFVILLALLHKAETRTGRMWWTLPGLFALWANLHGGWLVGIGVLGIWTAIRLVAPVGLGRGAWATLGAASLLATLVTPYGIELWRFLDATVSLRRENIVEWQPLTQRPLPDWLPWILGAVAGAIGLARAHRWRLTLAATYCLLLFSAFRVVRLGPFLVIAGMMLLAESFLRRRIAQRHAQSSNRDALAVGAIALVFVVGGSTAITVNLGCIRMEGPHLPDPTTAAAVRDARLAGRMLTWFDWGQYAIWFLAPDIAVSIDGRRETVYSDAVLAQHDVIYRLRAGWREEFLRLDPDYVWLPKSVPTTQAIEELGWNRISESRDAVVFAKNVVALTGSRPGGRECFPGNP